MILLNFSIHFNDSASRTAIDYAIVQYKAGNDHYCRRQLVHKIAHLYDLSSTLVSLREEATTQYYFQLLAA